MSAIGDRWLSEVLMREWWAGFLDGAILGSMFVAIVVACCVTYALAEAGDEA